MGKRGPKIRFNDLYHRVQRALVQRTRTRQKIKGAYDSAELRTFRAAHKKDSE